jgi:hypothetical protein
MKGDYMSLSISANRRLFLLLTFIILIFGCAKDDDNPITPDDSDKYMWVHFKGDSTKILFENLTKFTADGEEVIQLSSFIDTSLIHPFYDKNNVAYDSRLLYCYQIVGDDGFCASSKGYPNNVWEHLQLGHILASDRRVIFPDDKIDLAGAYNVKATSHIYVYRKFDLAFTDSTLCVELRNITPVQVTNPDNNLEEAILLKDVVAYMVTAPSSFQYNILSLDDFGPSQDMTWDQFQTGYWLLSSEKTMFADTSLSGSKYKVKVLEKILLK